MRLYLCSKNFYTSSLVLLIIVLVNKTTANEAQSSPSEKASADLSENNSESNIYSSSGEEEDNSISSDGDDDDDIDQASTRFSWKHHQDDHSVYAHRSLMSAHKVKQQMQKNLESKEKSISKGDDDDYDPLKTIDFAEKEWQLMFRSLDSMYDSVSSSLLQQIGKHTDLFDVVVSKLQPQCRRDIYHIRESIKKHKLWALRMLDSNGKIPSGVSYGKFSSPGDYRECIGVRVDEQVYRGFSGSGSASVLPSPEHYRFNGKYCLIDFRLPLPERPKNKLLSVYESVLDLDNTELMKQYPEIKNYTGYASVFYELGYMHALCLPSTCEVTDLTKSLNDALSGLYLIVNNTIDCEQHREEPLPLRTSQVISIILLSLLFLNAGCASIVYSLRHSKQYRAETKRLPGDRKHSDEHQRSRVTLREWILSKVGESNFYLDCFSIQTNLQRLTKPDPRGLTFVHYTRIVAMALTVITHTGALGTLQAITKPADTSNSEQIFRDFIPQMLANAFTSIQIFFFMAGLMLVISAYPSIKRERGHISFLEYAIKRAIRLMPGIAATICLNFLWPLFVDGPMLTYFIRLIVIPCESNWWRTLGFLSNFDHVEKMCLRHSYFSASDYQLHIMAFPLLILLYKQPTMSLIISGILITAGFAAQVIMVLTKTVLPFMMVDYIDKEAFFNVVHYMHHPVWNHMSAFFYGFIIGYLVVKQIRINLKERTIKYLWLIILPSGVLSIFAPYFWNHYRRPIHRWQMVLYVLFDRFALLTTCAWLSYATMVLGRRPTARKQPATTHLNLPEIVAIEHDKIKSQHSTDLREVKSATKVSATSMVEPSIIDTSRLSGTTGVGGIPRQQSSPNFLCLRPDRRDENDISQAAIRPAVSSNDLSSNQFDEAKQFKQQEFSAPNGTPFEAPSSLPKPEEQLETKERPKQTPISNVNTLCLMLSRLTFQLYLFNMVVLWIDVNNSRYLWYFSYYFIIIKAAAVYICSTILAMVFFVTMESPCLTLYIVWVKSRANTRAGRSRASAAEVAIAERSSDESQFGSSMAKNQDIGKVSPDSGKRSDFDGLCMTMGSNSSGFSKPTPGVIDLAISDPVNLSSSINQTKM